MIRPITIITAILASGSGLFLYQSKHDVQVLDRQIERTVRDTAALREQSRLLAAEWTMLNDPERLRQFSDTYLSLKPIAPTQFTSMADLNARLPAPRQAPPPSDDSTTDMAPVAAPLETPVAAATVPPPAVSQASEAADDGHPKLPEHKINVAKPAAQEAPAPRALVATEQRPAAAPEPRAPRPPDNRVAEVRPAQESRPAQEVRPAQEFRPAQESRPAQEARPLRLAQDVRPAQEGRPTQEVRPVLATRSVAPRPQAPATPPALSDAYNGSLLGIARGSAPAPSPRPTPVSATNWSSTN